MHIVTGSLAMYWGEAAYYSGTLQASGALALR